jgi:transposase
MAAQTARIWMPEMKVFYDRLIANGKLPKVAVIACARKLLRGLNAAQRTGQPFDATRLLPRTC